MKEVLLLVVVHGIFGWGGVAPTTGTEYYRGLQSFLQTEYEAELLDSVQDPTAGSHPRLILAPTLSRSGGVDVLGQELTQEIVKAVHRINPRADKTVQVHVHLLAHSLGGLVSRWVFVHADAELLASLRSLTTLSTPHQGTTVANWANAMSSSFLRTSIGIFDGIDKFFWKERDHRLFGDEIVYGIEHSSDRQLDDGGNAMTIQTRTDMNERWKLREKEIRDQNHVRYFAYGGRVQDNQSWVLRLLSKIIGYFGLPQEKCDNCQIHNDSLVSEWSAHYPWDDPFPSGQSTPNCTDPTAFYMGTVRFDHIGELGWAIPDPLPPGNRMPEDLKPLYREIVDRILNMEQGESLPKTGSRPFTY